MLSHLVGAANRADIRRLCQLEAENAELRARLDGNRRRCVKRSSRATRASRNCGGRWPTDRADPSVPEKPIACCGSWLRIWSGDSPRGAAERRG